MREGRSTLAADMSRRELIFGGVGVFGGRGLFALARRLVFGWRNKSNSSTTRRCTRPPTASLLRSFLTSSLRFRRRVSLVVVLLRAVPRAFSVEFVKITHMKVFLSWSGARSKAVAETMNGTAASCGVSTGLLRPESRKPIPQQAAGN